MNIVVCYKIVPDEQDAVVQADRTLSFERAALKIGDYDLNAVEAGAQLAAASGASLVSLTAGGDPVEDSKLKKAILARGPHENVAVKDASLPEAGSAVTARVLAAAVKQLDDVSLVLCGEGSADRYAQQVGVQLGELLGLPTVNAVSSIELDDGVAHVERTVGAVVERLDVPLPAVLSVVADMNTPRIPSMKDILGAGVGREAGCAVGRRRGRRAAHRGVGCARDARRRHSRGCAVRGLRSRVPGGRPSRAADVDPGAHVEAHAVRGGPPCRALGRAGGHRRVAREA